jgi:hypothetical protein
MIPYDDLVAALTAWRARQGMPVSTMGGSAAADSTPASGYSAPRTPPPRGKPASVPPPVASTDAEEVDAAMLDEAAYENLSDDIVSALGPSDGDIPTTVGAPPQPQRRDVTPPRGRGRRGKNEW